MHVTDRAVDVPTSGVELAEMAARLGSSVPQDGLGREGLVALVAAAQAVVNAAAALQDSALARLASVETDWAEDGTLLETVRPLGHVSIDAADLAAPALAATHAQAQRRMRQAVRVAAAREPVDDGSRALPEPTGLGGLHAAMREGRIDPFRAGVVAHELADAPADVAEAVIAALGPQLHRDAPTLRRRTRVLLGRISPDLLRERAERSRRETGLRRWVTEPGVDTWLGTFPSEDAATAWAAVDERARVLVAEGVCTTLEQARGKALTDLVTAQATVTISVVLTTPAEVMPQGVSGETGETGTTGGRATSSSDGTGTTEGQAARASDGTGTTGGPGARASDGTGTTGGRAASASDGTGTTGGRGASASDGTGTTGGQAASASVQTTSAVDGTDGGPEAQAGSAVTAVAVRERRDDDLIEVRGIRPTEAALVSRAWVERLLAAVPDSAGSTALTRQRAKSARPPGPPPDRHPGTAFEVRTSTAPCHPATGALQPDPTRPEVVGYRPPAWLVALVRARDGRCRFPGCSVAARFCDLDHVRPWPGGPTNPDNLACLCRRHHRVKQRPGWRVRMLPGAALEWTDPTGRVRTTDPQDALHGAVLRAVRPTAVPAAAAAVVGGSGDVEVDDAGFRVRLEHLLLRQRGATVWSRRCPRDQRVTVLHARFPRCAAAATRPARRTPPTWPDEPPF